MGSWINVIIWAVVAAYAVHKVDRIIEAAQGIRAELRRIADIHEEANK